MRDLTPTSPSEIAESQPRVLCLYDVCDVFKGGIAPVGDNLPGLRSSATFKLPVCSLLAFVVAPARPEDSAQELKWTQIQLTLDAMATRRGCLADNETGRFLHAVGTRVVGSPATRFSWTFAPIQVRIRMAGPAPGPRNNGPSAFGVG